MKYSQSVIILFYFTDNTCARFERLYQVYSCSITEVYLFFYQAIFKKFNKFLQREDPIIPVLYDQMLCFLKNLIGKFVTISAIKRAASDLTQVEL